jgi:hypothetical protein
MRQRLVFDLYRARGIRGCGFIYCRDYDNVIVCPLNLTARTLDNVHGLHTGHLLRSRGVNAHDLGVRVRTAHYFAKEHSGPVNVIRIFSAAGNLVRTVDARNSLADQ